MHPVPQPSPARDRAVGVIGLGIMGAPIAGHLLAGGVRVLVHSRRRSSAERLERAGALWRDAPAAVSADAATVLLIVPDLPEIRDLCLRGDGILAGAVGPTTVVVHSTCSPEGLRELQREIDRAKPGAVRLVDAPVSGGEEGARVGALSIMIGGDAEDVARVVPLLDHYGTSLHFGPLGAGEVAKACNQIVVAGAVVSLAEAAVLAEREGLDVDAVFEALGRGYAASRVLDSKRARFAQHDYSPSGAARYMIKDLSIALAGLEAAGVVADHTRTLLRVFTEVTDRGWGDLDTSVVQALIAGDDARAAGSPAPERDGGQP